MLDSRWRGAVLFRILAVSFVALLVVALSDAALPPGVEEERIALRRASAPEELVLLVSEFELEKERRFGFFGPVVREKHTLRGSIEAVKRSEAGLAEGSNFVLKVELNVREIERERREHERNIQRGWVGPRVYFMRAPVFSDGQPAEDNVYRMTAWVSFDDGELKPGAGPHSFGRPVSAVSSPSSNP